MRGRWLGVAAGLTLLLGGSAGVMSGDGLIRMLVADLPYERVWEAALVAVADYPIEHAAEGLIVTGPRARTPREDEEAFDRIVERVTLRVERRGERITRVTVEVTAQGWRDGERLDLPDTRATAREILARLAAAER